MNESFDIHYIMMYIVTTTFKLTVQILIIFYFASRNVAKSVSRSMCHLRGDPLYHEVFILRITI